MMRVLGLVPRMAHAIPQKNAGKREEITRGHVPKDLGSAVYVSYILYTEEVTRT